MSHEFFDPAFVCHQNSMNSNEKQSETKQCKAKQNNAKQRKDMQSVAKQCKAKQCIEVRSNAKHAKPNQAKFQNPQHVTPSPRSPNFLWPYIQDRFCNAFRKQSLVNVAQGSFYNFGVPTLQFSQKLEFFCGMFVSVWGWGKSFDAPDSALGAFELHLGSN